MAPTSPGGHDGAGVEASDDLAQAADVVHDRGHARSEHLQQRARDVDLGPVGKERDRGLRERAPQLRVGHVPEPPLGAVARGRAQAAERYPRVADDEQPRPVDAEHGLDGVLRPLVRADEPEAERRAAVVGPGDLRAEDRMPDHAELALGHAELDELRLPALRVHDDALEAAEQRSPQVRPSPRSGAGRCRAP